MAAARTTRWVVLRGLRGNESPASIFDQLAMSRVIPTGNIADDRFEVGSEIKSRGKAEDVIATWSVGSSQDKGRGGGFHWGA